MEKEISAMSKNCSDISYNIKKEFHAKQKEFSSIDNKAFL
jgi:hypothetical protein